MISLQLIVYSFHFTVVEELLDNSRNQFQAAFPVPIRNTVLKYFIS